MGANGHISIDGLSLGLRQIIDSSPALIHTARADGHFDFLNRTWLTFVGQPVENLLGWQWTSHVHPDDLDAFERKWRHSIDTGERFEGVARVLRADGIYRWMQHHMLALRGEDGRVIAWNGTSVDVTEHELMTQEMRRREAYSAGAQRVSQTGSFGWNPVTGTIAWSDETYRIFEYDSETNITLDKLVERTHPEDRHLLAEALEPARSGGGAVGFEQRLLFPDSRIKHIRVVAQPLELSPQPTEFIGAIIDITHSKRTEVGIRDSERELRTMIELIPAYVGTSSPNGTVEFVSQSWLEYAGLTREQASSWGSAGAIHPDDVDNVTAKWQEASAARRPVEQELRCRRADGTYHWFLNRKLPLCDDSGKIIKWYGALIDIDALKETQSALQMRELQLHGIVETIPSLIWSASPAGEVTHVNRRVREYSGMSIEQFVNLGWKSFIHPDDWEETSKAFFHAIQTGDSYRTVHRLRRADGEYRWHHAGGEALRDSQGHIIQWYGLAVDIDERMRAEDHLRDTRIKLNHASRIATVAELSASIAHQLNQPLMCVLANAQAARRWLLADPPNLPQTGKSIDRIIRDARGADEVMQRIRALFKHEPFHKKEVSVPDLLREAVRFVRDDRGRRGTQIGWRLPEDLPIVSVDVTQMQQVFVNLITNAVEAMEASQASAQVVLCASARNQEMLIQVIDNGSGVADPEGIFEAFVTTKQNGMGIGLAVARSIVEAHGGRLWAEKNPEGGAAFNLTLPLPSASSNSSSS